VKAIGNTPKSLPYPAIATSSITLCGSAANETARRHSQILLYTDSARC